MNKELLAYFRCPKEYVDLQLSGALSNAPGYFQFNGVTCYGRRISDARHATSQNADPDACYLGFDPDEVAENIRCERYLQNAGRRRATGHNQKPNILRQVYYGVRPWLPVWARRHLQKLALQGWKSIAFPNWPLDLTVDAMFTEIMRLLLEQSPVQRIPFIWFWPEGARSCVIMTHDVEEEPGRAFCGKMMDMDEAFGVKSSFQIVPEKRYPVTEDFLNNMVSRGFEVNLHGLCHDGRLFENHEEFCARAEAINHYGASYGSAGFRSPIMYRNADWMDKLAFDYDMSFPNTAHLDPQRGGCGTIMPYFLGNMVELPLTMLQDYTMFYILHRHSIDLWRYQAETVIANHGLISFIVHPDYIIEPRHRRVYKNLLRYLRRLCRHENVVNMLPLEVSRWWRQRSRMRLTRRGGEWVIEGDGKERARIAYATLEANKLIFDITEGCTSRADEDAAAFARISS